MFPRHCSFVREHRVFHCYAMIRAKMVRMVTDVKSTSISIMVVIRELGSVEYFSQDVPTTDRAERQSSQTKLQLSRRVSSGRTFLLAGRRRASSGADKNACSNFKPPRRRNYFAAELMDDYQSWQGCLTLLLMINGLLLCIYPISIILLCLQSSPPP